MKSNFTKLDDQDLKNITGGTSQEFDELASTVFPDCNHPERITSDNVKLVLSAGFNICADINMEDDIGNTYSTKDGQSLTHEEVINIVKRKNK